MTNYYIEYFEPQHFGNDWGIFVDIENQKLDEINKLDTTRNNKLIPSYIINIYSALILIYYIYYLFAF